MTKVNFHKQINFFQLSCFVKENHLNHSEILKQGFQTGALKDENQKFLYNFIKSIGKTDDIKSQLYQDLFAKFIVGDKFNKSFLEFGATDGLNLSNTYWLETFHNWNGLLSEPSTQWHEKLEQNRPNTSLIKECIWSESNKKLDFFISDKGEFSTIEQFKEYDRSSMPANTDERVKSGKKIIVNTISLNDVLEKKFQSKVPSYISIDTEGSEYEILKYFDFKKYRPLIFTIEHNFTVNEKKIDKLMNVNDYVKVFNKLTFFDGWYITKEIFDELNY